MRISRLIWTGLIALAFASAIVSGGTPARSEPAVLGNPQAKLKIVELVDYQCPYCQIVHQRLMEALATDHNAQVEIKPLSWISEESGELAKLVIASGRQGKDLALHQALLNKDKPQSFAQALEIAEGLGIDAAQAQKDMALPEVKEQVLSNLKYAMGLKLPTTPGLLIGDTLYAPNKDELPSVHQLRLMIDEQTKR